MTLTHEMAKSLIEYDPETGLFTWKFRAGKHMDSFNRRLSGKPAGALAPNGYIKIELLGHSYQAHRLAWFLETGVWPSKPIDHADRNKSNNRFANLREASHGENRANSNIGTTNTSGVKGVSWNARIGKWQAQIGVNSRTIYLGCFDQIEAAGAAYEAAATAYFGEFGRAA